MIGIKYKLLHYYSYLYVLVIWLCFFQNPLEGINTFFAYIDEGIALLGAVLTLYHILIKRELTIKKDIIFIFIPLCIFLISGLTGNIIYNYQPISAVVIDFYTNIKFFLALLTGIYFLGNIKWNDLSRLSNINAKIITIIMFAIFVFDRIFNFYPGNYRYGIKVAKLFFGHATYLAGAVVFLVTLLTVFYQKRNLPYIFMNLIMLAFTLRFKAFGAVALYIALFVIIVVLKFELKLWHIAVLAVIAAVVGWPKIHYYFIELAWHSTRSVLLMLSFVILKDYFPIGTGFGTYASSQAEKHFSPVYKIYNFENLVKRDTGWRGYMNDSFWPIIVGQTGFLGTIAYLIVMVQIAWKIFNLQKFNKYIFVGIMFSFGYLGIASLAEPAFNNAVAVPLAILMGLSFKMNYSSNDLTKE